MAFLEINLTHGFSQWLVGDYAGVVNLKDLIPQLRIFIFTLKPWKRIYSIYFLHFVVNLKKMLKKFQQVAMM